MPTFNPAILKSKTQIWLSEVDTVTVTRRTGDPINGYAVSTIYSGIGECQEKSGSYYANPEGVVEQADAMLILDCSTPPIVPTVNVGDMVVYAANGKEYTVVNVSYLPFAFPHLECLLKSGPLSFDQRG